MVQDSHCAIRITYDPERSTLLYQELIETPSGCERVDVSRRLRTKEPGVGLEPTVFVYRITNAVLSPLRDPGIVSESRVYMFRLVEFAPSVRVANSDPQFDLIALNLAG